MLELGLLFLTVSTFLRAFGPDVASVVSSTLEIAIACFVAWLAAGLLAFVFQRPLDRRILRHA
jgi:hypothetical protein